MVVPRKSKELTEARALWSTHLAINRAVAYYEGMLLEMRGGSYQGPDETMTTAGVVKASLNQRIRAACRNNGSQENISDEDLALIRTLLRSLYEVIVPSSIGEKGNAQQANAYISPLTDPDSNAFQAIFDKIGSRPAWLEGCRNGNPDAASEAQKWLETDEGKARLAATGAPPKWARMARKKDDGWTQAFVADYDRKVKDAEGGPTIIKELRNRKVFPLFKAYLSPRIEGSRGKVSPWDRLAFRLAAGHLMQWESWCRIAANTHAQWEKRLEDFQSTYLDTKEHSDAIQALRGYEQEREAELSKMGLGPASFRIRARMVRGWDELRAKWINSSDRTAEKLCTLSAEMQAKLKGSFGDPHLFAWLARPENHNIWDTRSVDVVKLLAQENALTERVERSREYATMTLPDPVFHPRCAQWEAEGGNNLKTYKIAVRNGKLFATLPLLCTVAGDRLKEHSFTFPIAPSSQLRNPAIEGGVSIVYQNQADETFSGVLRSADLLFDWTHFQHRPEERVASGDIGPAYLKLVIDIQQMLPEGWDGKRAGFVNHFISALGNDKYADAVTVGARVISVDLGLRYFASCSVFELHDKHPGKGKLCFQAGTGFWAVHERSFVLRIPGEEVGSRGKAWRESAREELRGLRGAINRYRSLYRIATVTDERERNEQLNTTLSGLEEQGGGIPFEVSLFKDLRKQTGLSPAAWQEAVAAMRKIHKTETGKIIGEWRRRNRANNPHRTTGKSMWSIQYLTDVRRFLVSWSHLGNSSGEIRRLDRTMQGIFASKLLKHINGIKEDRLKTGADLIVQAARGYVRDTSGKWQKKFEPCHVVLFEDLSRYRMKTDRPRRENSQLMRWAHRQIPKEVQLQAELYGIHICYTDAAFSSRVHAATMAPGVRCHPLKAVDLENSWFRQIVEHENPSINWPTLTSGDIIPLSGGELFVCLGNGGMVQINADINAAQNLQRRFWERHGTPIRIPCRHIKANGEDRWMPRNIGKRLKGSMGLGWLVPTGDASGSCRWEKLTPKQWRKYGGTQNEDTISMPDELVDTEEFDEETLLETTGEVIVFFRDTSGAVLPRWYWYPSKHFWGVVKTRTNNALMR